MKTIKMTYAMRRTLFFLLCGPPFFTIAQTTFTASPTLVVAAKPADNFVFYNYTQFENLTEDTLQMRWVKQTVVANYGGGGHGSSSLGDWTTSIQDPNTFYNPADAVDSADFYLPPVTGATDKFILQLYPNLQAGTLLMQFKFFPVSAPSDSLTVTFDYTSEPVATASSEKGISSPVLTAFPNPASTAFSLANAADAPQQVCVFTITGQPMLSAQINAHETMQIACSNWPVGKYLLVSKTRTSCAFLLIQH